MSKTVQFGTARDTGSTMNRLQEVQLTLQEPTECSEPHRNSELSKFSATKIHLEKQCDTSAEMLLENDRMGAARTKSTKASIGIECRSGKTKPSNDGSIEDTSGCGATIPRLTNIWHQLILSAGVAMETEPGGAPV